MSAFIFSERTGQGPQLQGLPFQTVNTVTYFAGLKKQPLFQRKKKKKKKGCKDKAFG